MSFNRWSLLFLMCMLSAGTIAGEPSFFAVETSFSLKKVKVGESVNLTIKLVALASSKINKEAPLTLEIKPSEHISATKLSFTRSDAKKAEDHEIKWELPIKVTKPGRSKVEGHLKFYLCTDIWCRKFEKDISETIDASLPS